MTLRTLKLPKIKDLFSQPISLFSALDEIPIGILILNTDRKVVFLNRAMEGLTGFSGKEALNISCYNITRNKICLRACPALLLKNDSEPVCIESDLINRDRRLIPVRITLARLNDIKGKPAGFLETVEDLRSVKELSVKMNRAYSFGDIIGKSEQMEKLFQIIPALAQNDTSILITGETGTGKDLLAEAIHQSSNRAKGPFIKLNCGAFPETLLESEIFGHMKGAFTGAVSDKPGRIRLANNGTLYLTEIGDLPFPLQVKLLTFLDDKVFYPLGSAKPIQVDVRIVAGTHRNLEQMVQNGGFREDLLFRLNVARLKLPPLRERGDDVRLLLDYFINRFASHFGKKTQGFTDDALMILKNYRYPGNVRELKNIVEYSINICQGKKIGSKHLPAYLTEKSENSDSDILETRGLSPLPEKKQYDKEDLFTGQNWASVEKKMIINALINARGRKSKAAAILGWGRSTLWRKMKQYEIEQ
ncbi:MAG: sigma 54-interacting transcriptional regulator [Deltaproteobacteria bacterium]|nr:sigma 54-interacting transcriptional regulator [Deltaproteobacteria bacterium]